MKFTLKNKPEAISRPFSRKPWCNPEESAEWFEGFEKELQARLATDGTFTYKRPKQRTRHRLTQLGKFISEILGEF